MLFTAPFFEVSRCRTFFDFCLVLIRAERLIDRCMRNSIPVVLILEVVPQVRFFYFLPEFRARLDRFVGDVVLPFIVKEVRDDAGQECGRQRQAVRDCQEDGRGDQEIRDAEP